MSSLPRASYSSVTRPLRRLMNEKLSVLYFLMKLRISVKRQPHLKLVAFIRGGVRPADPGVDYRP